MVFSDNDLKTYFQSALRIHGRIRKPCAYSRSYLIDGRLLQFTILAIILFEYQVKFLSYFSIRIFIFQFATKCALGKY